MKIDQSGFIESMNLSPLQKKIATELMEEKDREIAMLRLAINEVDSTLLEWENYLHDENGKRFTDLRKRIAKLTKTTWEDYEALKKAPTSQGFKPMVRK